MATVISGSDGDLGVLTENISYSVTSDVPCNLTVTVNGGVLTEFVPVSGQTYQISVLDLPTGTGTIVLSALRVEPVVPGGDDEPSTPGGEPSGVTITRTWTYSKPALGFPDAGGVAELREDGATRWPQTLAEAVRTCTAPWGGNLSAALDRLKFAALYQYDEGPKYNEVNVSLSGAEEGDVVSLPEDGVMTPFVVAKLNYESSMNGTGRTLLVRQSPYPTARQWNASNSNALSDSSIDQWLNGDYKALFPADMQSAMETTEFDYTVGGQFNTALSTLSRSVFMPSLSEMAKSANYNNTEGSSFPAAARTLLNQTARDCWTRTPETSGAGTSVYYLNSSGAVYAASASQTHKPWPCFTLPSTFSATYYADSDGVVHDEPEYTPDESWTDLWGNAIPALRIAHGTYTGTGTYGEDNPNSLSFRFTPKIWGLYGYTYDTNYSTTDIFSSDSDGFIMPWGVNVFVGGYPHDDYSAYTYDGNTVSWYSPDNASTQHNDSDCKYFYFAIG